MGKINVSRCLLGGFVAAIIIFLIEGASSVFYMAEMEASLRAHNLAVEMGPGMFAIGFLVSLVTGLVCVFFYAAVRPRFGPGPTTAMLVACVLWLGGYLLSLVGLGIIGLYSVRMLTIWGAIGLVEMIAATVVGAWLYKEA